MQSGTIILLNGTSSSGKTSIARALLDVRDCPYFYVGVDHFNSMRPGWSLGNETTSEGVAMNSALHHAVAALARNGWSVILEHVLVNPVYRRECIDLLVEYPVLFVGVRCPLDVLERRERERSDRTIGIARDQFERAHAHGMYDIEVDTSLHNPVECAQQIQRRLADGRPFTALHRLREQWPIRAAGDPISEGLTRRVSSYPGPGVRAGEDLVGKGI